MGEIATVSLPIEINGIRELLPHRWPMLLVDKVVELKHGKSIRALKAVTATEFWVPGHFPNRTLMPGVLMIEAIAQAGAILFLIQPQYRGKPAVLGGVNDARFRRVVVPGDLLTIDAEILSFRMGVARIAGTIHVEGELAVKAQLQLAFVNS
jgi:3-hydroxyacyl-[acyl-carrier-protein] dehydratase